MNNIHDEFRLANNPETDLCQLEILADSENELIKGAVALNNSTPEYLLKKLFFDKSTHVQDCLLKRLKQH